MNCADYLELISGHIDGQNTEAEEAQLQAHLAECAQCREILAAYEQINTGAASLEAEPPVGLVSAVMGRVCREAGGVPAKKKKKFSFGHGTAFAAVAAVLVILVGTGLVELPGRNMAKMESASDASVAESATVADDSVVYMAPDALTVQAQTEESAEAEMESGAVIEEAAPYESAGDYNAVFDAISDATVTGGASQAPLLEAATDSVMQEAPEADVPAAVPDSMESETERAEETVSEFVVYAEVYDYAGSEPIDELTGLTQSETESNVYFGTASEILQIVEQYQNTHSISCSVASGYADADAACIVVFE